MLRGTPTTSTTATTTTTTEHVHDSTPSYHASSNNARADPEEPSIMIREASSSSSSWWWCRRNNSSSSSSSINCGCDDCDCNSCSVKYVEVTCPASLCEGTSISFCALSDHSFSFFLFSLWLRTPVRECRGFLFLCCLRNSFHLTPVFFSLSLFFAYFCTYYMPPPFSHPTDRIPFLGNIR